MPPVGTPGEDLGSGTSKSLTPALSPSSTISIPESWLGRRSTRSSTGVPGTTENNDSFGQVLDSVRSGSTTHLAVGIPFEAIGSAAKAGSVQLFSSTGTTITPGTGLTQDTTGVSGTATAGDEFGRRIVFGTAGVG